MNRPVWTQRAVDLVGRDVQETEIALLPLREPIQIAPGGVEQLERALHVCADELGRPVDRPIDVRLGREVHDRRGLEQGEHPLDGLAIGDVALDKRVTRIGDGRLQRVEIARVCQLVEVDHAAGPFGEALPDETTADETGAAGDQNCVHGSPFPTGLVIKNN